MNGETRPKVTPSQIIWIVACVVLLTSLFLIGAWLFKPQGEAGPGGKDGPGGITEQEVNAPGFTPEGQRPGAPPPLPEPPQEATQTNAAVPTPASLASRLPTQTAQPPSRAPEKASPAVVPEAPAPAPKPAQAAASTTSKPGGPAPATPAPAPAPKPAPPALAKPAPAQAEKPSSTAKEPSAAKGDWFLQVAAVSDKKKAAELQKQLKEKGFPSAPLVHEGALYKVRIPYRDEGGARAAKKKLDGAGIRGTEGAFVVKPEK